jgi:hypothetical protein
VSCGVCTLEASGLINKKGALLVRVPPWDQSLQALFKPYIFNDQAVRTAPMAAFTLAGVIGMLRKRAPVAS